MRIFDLHALIGDTVRARLQRGEREARPLLVPEAVVGQLADAHIDALAGVGVQLGKVGDNDLLLRAVPKILTETDSAHFARSLVVGCVVDSGVVELVAAAAAASFRAPTAIADTRAWFTRIAGMTGELDLELAKYFLDLDTDALARWFTTRNRE